MTIGEKIQELRKKQNLSQESLAEKIGVTRQTISKWETSETSPDLKQSKYLAKVLEVSLDELTNNEINVLSMKVNNTERLAGLTIKISKIVGLVILILVIIDLLSFVLFVHYEKNKVELNYNGYSVLECVSGNKKYEIELSLKNNEGSINCKDCEDVILIDSLTAYFNLEDFHGSVKQIVRYIENNGGTCKEK